MCHACIMTDIKKRKLNLRIIPALLPSVVGAFVALMILGNNLGILMISLAAGYCSYILASALIEFIWNLQRNRR